MVDYREDPFQKIVNVGWDQQSRTLSFHSFGVLPDDGALADFIGDFAVGAMSFESGLTVNQSSPVNITQEFRNNEVIVDQTFDVTIKGFQTDGTPLLVFGFGGMVTRLDAVNNPIAEFQAATVSISYKSQTIQHTSPKTYGAGESFDQFNRFGFGIISFVGDVLHFDTIENFF